MIIVYYYIMVAEAKGNSGCNTGKGIHLINSESVEIKCLGRS